MINYKDLDIRELVALFSKKRVWIEPETVTDELAEKIKNIDDIEYLISNFGDFDYDVKTDVLIKALVKLKTDDVIAALIKALGNSASEIVCSAAIALGEIGDSQAVAPL